MAGAKVRQSNFPSWADSLPIPVGLLMALNYHDEDRWSRPTICAAIGVDRRGEGLSAREWADLLDRIEAALGLILPAPAPA